MGEEWSENGGGRSDAGPKRVQLAARGLALVAAGLGAIHLSTIVRATQDRESFDALLGWAAEPWSSAWLPAVLVACLLLHAAFATISQLRGARGPALASRDEKNVRATRLRRWLGVAALAALMVAALSWRFAGLNDYDRSCAVLSATWLGFPLPAVLALLGAAACFGHAGLGMEVWLRERPEFESARWVAWCAAGLAVSGFVFALVSVLRLATGSGALW